MTRDTLTIRPEPPRQPDVLRLLNDAEAQSAELYPVESRHHAGIDTLESHQVRFFVARLGGEAVGTGGYLPDGAGQAELKRLFVTAAARGQGIACGILAALEQRPRGTRAPDATGDRRQIARGARTLSPRRLSRTRSIRAVCPRSTIGLHGKTA
jgi:GNAT superfamily N-acetyltransferase